MNSTPTLSCSTGHDRSYSTGPHSAGPDVWLWHCYTDHRWTHTINQFGQTIYSAEDLGTPAQPQPTSSSQRPDESQYPHVNPLGQTTPPHSYPGQNEFFQDAQIPPSTPSFLQQNIRMVSLLTSFLQENTEMVSLLTNLWETKDVNDLILHSAG